jgi:hypothetical protein
LARNNSFQKVDGEKEKSIELNSSASLVLQCHTLQLQTIMSNNNPEEKHPLLREGRKVRTERTLFFSLCACSLFTDNPVVVFIAATTHVQSRL